MQFPARDFTNQYISSSYQNVLQKYEPSDIFYVLDGLGNVVFTIPSASVGQMLITADITASMSVLSASHAEYSDNAEYALAAYYSTLSDTASYLRPGANIYLSQSYITSVTNSVAPAYKPATMYWDDIAKTYAIYSDHPGVSLQIGQENWIRVYAGEYIPNGSAVYISSSIGDIPIVKLALADAIQISNRSFVIGLATENISSGSIGVVTSHGQVHDLDTSAYSPGQSLFLSSIQSGSLVGESIVDPYNIVSIGNVVTSDPTNGIIHVNISNIGSYDYPAIGPVYVPTITNLGGSTFSVGTASVNFCTTADGTGHIYSYLVPSASFTITSSFLDVQYLIANYGNGVPFYSIETDYHDLNEFQTATIATFTVGTSGNISWVDWDSSGVTLANKLLHRIVDLYGAQRSDGLELGHSNSNITITSGHAFMGIKELILPPTTTATPNSFVLLAHSASVWSGSFINGIVNDIYDNGTNLQILGSNKYVVNYIWRGIGNLNRSQVLLSTQYNNYADAVAAIMPAPPIELQNIAIFCGRMVVQQGTPDPLLIESAFNTVLSIAGITNHNDLNNIQGGLVGEYYHLSSASYSGIISGTSRYAQTASLAYSYISNVKSVTSTYNVLPTDQILIATGSVPITFILPNYSGSNGKSLIFKNRNQSPMYILTTDNSNIDDAQSYTASYKNTSIHLQCSGSEWFII